MLSCFARRNDANDATAVALAVANQEKVSAAAHAEHEKALFACGVQFVVELNGELVVEDGLSLLEGNVVLPEVRCGLSRIPVKLDHLYIVWMIDAFARPNA